MSDHLDQGISPEQCARIMVRAIEKGCEEVIAGDDILKLAVYIKRFFPGLFSKILRKAKTN